MDTFSIIREALRKSESDPAAHAGLSHDEVIAGRVIAAVQTVVDALTPPVAGRYVVGFANIGTAGTDLHALNIFVSSKPLYDQSLSLIEKCVVITTLAAHEIGHTHVTAPRKDLIGAHNPSSGFHAVANLADDIILEPFMVERFPILADAFEFTGLWVLRNGKGPFPKVYRMKRDMTTADRFNVILNGSRYGDVPEVVFVGAAEAERDWSRDWARRLIASPLKDHGAFLALVDEAWVRIREEAPEDEQPEQPPIIDDGESSTEGEPENGDEGDDEGDDGSTDGEGDDESDHGDDDATTRDPNDAPRDWDDDDDDADDGDGDGSDGEGEDGDEPDGDTGSGDSKDGEPSDGETNDGDEQGDEPGESNDGESTSGESTDVEDGEQGTGDGDEGGGGGAASSIRDEDSFDKNEADESAHEQSQSRNTPRDTATEQAVRTYASTTVTSFGKHGTMTTVWD